MDFNDPELQAWAVAVARKASVRFPSWQFASGEIENEALVALWGCIDRFTGGTREEFYSFATMRIRGAMIDLMRERGDHSRRDYEKAKESGEELPNRRMQLDGEDGVGALIADPAPPPDAAIEAWSEVWALKWHLLNEQQLRWVRANASGMDQKAFAEREGVTQSRVSQLAATTIRILRGLQPRTSVQVRVKKSGPKVIVVQPMRMVPCSGPWRFSLWRPHVRLWTAAARPMA